MVRLVTTASYVQLGPGEVMLAYAPLGFDASTLEIWGALLSGASLAVFPPRLASLDELGRFIEEAGVTTLWLTAGLFQLMVETQLARLRGVRQLVSGGDVLSPAHARRLCQALPELTLVNGYGPTEATVFTCCHVMRADAAPGPRVPIGRPIANAEVQILDGRTPSRCRSAWRARSTSAATDWREATCARLRRRASASSPIRLLRASACIEPETSRAGGRTARSTSSAAATRR